MNNQNTFTLDGVTYSQTKTGYCYKTTGKQDKKGNDITVRIPKHIYEQRFDEFMAQADETEDWDMEQEVAERKVEKERKQKDSDKQAEDAVNGKKKVAKPRKSKDIAFSYCPNGTDVITLTAKQVDFIKHISDTCFYENGLDSTPWCDVLTDEIGGQFAGKPMTVGAMISTLREKHLIDVGMERMNGKKAKYLVLTDLGKAVAKELGLN